MKFQLVTDTGANLTDEMIERFDIRILSLTFMSNGEQFRSYIPGQKSDLKSFYDMMRNGKVFTTSLPSQKDADALFREVLDAGRDLLYIGFSSGISGTYNAMAAVLDALRSEYPERKIYSVESFAAAMGQGLLVYKAALMAEDGAEIEEVNRWVEENRLNLAHWFTVEDLVYLFRGGRVSRTSAWAGSLLNIKPVLHVDDEGKLIPMEKVRGRKKSIQALFNHMKESALPPVADQTVFISHGDCQEDADYLSKLIREGLGVTDIQYNILEPVIGAHAGPGTLALFFMADKR